MTNYWAYTNDRTWNTWTTSTTSSTTTGDVWHYWTGYNSTTTASTTGTVWYNWANDRVIRLDAPIRVAGARQPTAQERVAENRIALARTREKERLRLARVANLKAMRLLRGELTDQQWQQLKEKGFFEVIGVSGKKYELHKSSPHGNVVAVDFKRHALDRAKRQGMCAHPRLNLDDRGRLPMADVLVAQKLALEFDEDEFLRVANLS